MPIRSIINPWVKGFRPPSKCPICGGINTLVFTDKRTQNGDHVYQCSACKRDVGSPTQYATCHKHGSSLEKDVFHTPCINCIDRLITPRAAICKYWENAHWTDTTNADDISDTIRKYFVDN